MNTKSYNIGDKILDQKRNITITNIYIDNTDHKKYYDYICNTCGYIGQHVLYSKLIYKNIGCQCCCKNSKILVPDINTVGAKFPNIKDILVDPDDADKYLPGSNKLVAVKCPQCNTVYYRSIALLTGKGFSCPNCRRTVSKANKMFKCLLMLADVKFEFEKTFNWSKRKIYDFYLTDTDTIVELNGGQHYNDTIWGTKEKQCINDNLKRTLAINNGIHNYIVIDCSAFTNTNMLASMILNSNLPIDVSNITVQDLIIEYYKIDNLYASCEKLYKSGLRTASEISDVLKYSKTWISCILKELATSGRIDYSSKDAINVHRRKIVLDTYTGITYRSILECSVKLNIARSSIAANKKRFLITKEAD